MSLILLTSCSAKISNDVNRPKHSKNKDTLLSQKVSLVLIKFSNS